MSKQHRQSAGAEQLNRSPSAAFSEDLHMRYVSYWIGPPYSSWLQRKFWGSFESYKVCLRPGPLAACSGSRPLPAWVKTTQLSPPLATLCYHKQFSKALGCLIRFRLLINYIAVTNLRHTCCKDKWNVTISLFEEENAQTIKIYCSFKIFPSRSLG